MSTRYLILALALTCAIPNAQAAPTNHSASANKSATTSGTSAAKQGAARTTKKRRVVASGHGAYFVPPPPAYMPSVLPELYARQPIQIDAEEEEEIVAAVAAKPKNPYVQYFYSRNESAPKPVQSRNGVSTWVVTR